MTSQQREEQLVEAFNRHYPVGTLVRYWRGIREGEGRTGKTTSAGYVLSGHTAVVMIEGSRGCIALSHVEPLPQEMVIRSRELKGSLCPGCGKMLDAVTAAAETPEGTIPTEGQLTACAYCGALLQFHDGRLVPAAPERLDGLDRLSREILEGTIKRPLRILPGG